MLFHANDLLDLRFLQTCAFSAQYKPGSVSEAILEIVTLITHDLKEKNIKITIDIERLDYCHPILMFDKRRLQQVVLNLLSNAIKF